MPKKTRLSVMAAGLALVLSVTGCETVPLEPSPNFVGNMVVSTEYAQFFRLGPQQAGGADLSLRSGKLVMLQRKEFGYSRVQLEDGQVGYMANEDLQPAPPEPPRKRGLRSAAADGRSRNNASGRVPRGAQDYDEETFNNIALPDPNLDIMPEDVPLEPLPELIPAPVDD
ncbi:MAG: hypothetical protein JHC85_00005, partial [Chthoniobacterales bacterium]|nr:hypothetical protein [Chthoniobacterales bacterium]